MKKEMDQLKIQGTKVTTEKDIMAARIAQVNTGPPHNDVPQALIGHPPITPL